MKSDHLYNLCDNLCDNSAWDEVRKYLASDASKKEKKQQVSYQDSTLKYTCLHLACINGAPDDIVKSMIVIGGKNLVMVNVWQKKKALHYACYHGASFNVMKMLIDVGGKDLVMAKNSNGDTALHYSCRSRNPADKIKLILEAANTEEILQAKNDEGKTPYQIAIRTTASTEIQDLLRPSQPSTAVLDNEMVATESNKRQTRQVTLSKQCTASPITPPPEDTHILLDSIRQLQEQLKEANDREMQIQRDFNEKQVTCTNLQEQLVDSTNQATRIQRDFDEKYAEVENLKSNLQAECEEKLTLMSTWAQENKKNEKLQTILQQQKAKTDEDNAFLTKHADNLTKVCSDQKIKLQEMEDAANAIEAAERKRKRNNEGGRNDECSITTAAAALLAQKRKTNEDNAFLKRHADESQTHGMQQGQGTSSKQCTVPPTAPVEGTSVPSSMDTIRSLQEELKESNDRERKIQHDLDEQCADNINLQKIKLQFEGALLQRDEQVEILQLEVATLKQQAISSQQENTHSHETEGVANATASAGGKRKRGSEEHMFTSHEMEGSAGDNSMTDMVMMRQYLLERECHSKEREQHSKERERHSKVLTQLFEIRRAEL